MKSSLIVLLVVLIALTMSVATLSSCGNEFRLGTEFVDDFWQNDIYLNDGDRRGEYVYYHGSWHYRGYGTPYYWDYYR